MDRVETCRRGSDSLRSPADPSTGTAVYPLGDLIAVYSEQLPWYRAAVSAVAGTKWVEPVLAVSLAEFVALAPSIPYIGPLQYPLPKTLAESGVALSFGKALRTRGMATAEIGRVILAAFRESQRDIPARQQREQGEMQFSGRFHQIQESMAQASHRSCRPGDWVYDFIEAGCDDSFDWGLDFTECGILKLYQAQGMPELVPYLCMLDFLVSDLQGTGLKRHGTLAAGADRCDFRYKKDRPVRIPAV